MNAKQTKEAFLNPGDNRWRLVRWAMFILLQEFSDHQDELKDFAAQIIQWCGPGNESVFDGFEDYLHECGSIPSEPNPQFLLNIVGDYFARRPKSLSEEKTQWVCRIFMLQKFLQDYQAEQRAKLSDRQNNATL